jgi:hypothetical protein
MVLANQNAKLTGPDQGFLVSRLVLTLKPWERGCTLTAQDFQKKSFKKFKKSLKKQKIFLKLDFQKKVKSLKS